MFGFLRRKATKSSRRSPNHPAGKKIRGRAGRPPGRPRVLSDAQRKARKRASTMAQTYARRELGSADHPDFNKLTTQFRRALYAQIDANHAAGKKDLLS